MEASWLSLPFAEICTHSAFGPRFSSDEYAADGNVATLRTKDISLDGTIDLDSMPLAKLDLDKLRHHVLQSEDLVITRTGRVGTTAIFTDHSIPVLPGAFLIRFRLNRDCADPWYYLYFFNSPAGQQLLKSIATGSVQQNLNITSIHGLVVPVPPLDKQQAIAGVLKLFDDKIRLNRRTNQTLEQMAAAIFKAWFVDFEPVKAKADGAKSFPSMPQEVFDALPTEFTDSLLGPVPKGWNCLPLPDLIEVNPSRSLRKGDVAPYLAMANMPTQGHTPEIWIDRPFGSGMRFINGDTLVARITPCLENGKTAFVDFLQDAQIGWGSTEYIVLRPRPPLPLHFAYCLARNEDFRMFAIQRMTGSSGRQRVPNDSLQQFLLAAPPEEVGRGFGDFVVRCSTRRDSTWMSQERWQLFVMPYCRSCSLARFGSARQNESPRR